MDTRSQPLLPPPPSLQSTNPQQPPTQSAPRNQHNFFSLNRHNQQRFKAIVHILHDYSIKNTSPYFQASGRLVRSTWYHILFDSVRSRNQWTNPTPCSLPQPSAHPTLSSWILQAQLKVVVKESNNIKELPHQMGWQSKPNRAGLVAERNCNSEYQFCNSSMKYQDRIHLAQQHSVSNHKKKG
jgi:hypothetical protein